MKLKEKEKFLPNIQRKKSKKTYIYSISFFIIYVLWYCKLINHFLNQNNIIKNPTMQLREILNIVINIVLFVVLFFILKEDLKRDTKFFKENSKAYIDYGFSLLIRSFIIMIICNVIVLTITKQTSVNQTLINNSSLLFQIINGIILAPIVEECTFRGLMRKILKNKYIFLFMSSMLFGLAHIIGLVTEPIQYLLIIPYAILGFAFAYNYEKTDNLTSTIVVHMLSNTFLLVMSLILTHTI